jgi:SAM-dependent methyltransferase
MNITPSQTEVKPAQLRNRSASTTPSSCRICFASHHGRVLVANAERALLKCAACGVAYLEPQPDPFQVANHLTEHYIRDEVQTEHHFGKGREAVLSRVAASIVARKRGGNILDVGCAGGYFLNRYFNSSDWQPFGVEPSKYAAEKADKRGIRVFQGQLSDVQLPEAHFDVVTIFDTFSYFRDPRRDLRGLRKALKSDGLLVIELPLAGTTVWRHATRLGRMLGGFPMSLLDGGQNFLYSPSSMRLLLQDTGYRQVGSDNLPGNKQRDSLRDFFFGFYYLGSTLVWVSSGNAWMLGPNFAVMAVPNQVP